MKVGDIIQSSGYYGIIIDKTNETRTMYKVHWVGYGSTDWCTEDYVSQFSILTTGERHEDR